MQQTANMSTLTVTPSPMHSTTNIDDVDDRVLKTAERCAGLFITGRGDPICLDVIFPVGWNASPKR